MERIEKMTLEEKRTLNAEEKLVRKKLLRNQYYKEYYSKNKDNYKEYKNTYCEKSGYIEKTNEKMKTKYNDDLEFRAKKKLEYYKRNYKENKEIVNIFNKDINFTNKLKEVKIHLLNEKL